MSSPSILLICGNAPNQKALAHKIASQFSLKAIVVETNHSKKKTTLKQLILKIAGRLFLQPLHNAWSSMMSKYSHQFPEWPSCEIFHTNNVNSPEVVRFSKEQNASLFMVSGTRLIKKDLLALQPEIGIVNLHTGLSPYVKGGPNCTNWCLSNKEFHLIGNTIMWLDEGIDTGNLITTDFVNFSGEEDLKEIHWKVMEQAHDLYLKAIESIFTRRATKPGIMQSSIDVGKTYYNKMWGLKEQLRVLKHLYEFRKAVKSGVVFKERKNIRTIMSY